MKVKIIYLDPRRELGEYEHLLPLVSEKRRERIARLRLERDKITSLMTGLLICGEISQRLNIPHSELRFGYGEHGKPYLLNNIDYRFSVSHSGECIAFAGSFSPVGLDVQRITEARLRPARRFFTEREYRYILGSDKRDLAFHRLWTSKEAYVKLLGTGLSTPLGSFDVLDGSTSCVFLTKLLSDYMLTVCTADRSEKKIEIETVSAEELISRFEGAK